MANSKSVSLSKAKLALEIVSLREKVASLESAATDKFSHYTDTFRDFQKKNEALERTVSNLRQGVQDAQQVLIKMSNHSDPTNPIFSEALRNVVRRLRDLFV